MLTNFVNAIEIVKENEYKVTQAKNGTENIHQTQRNELGAFLRKALGTDLSKVFPATDDSSAAITYITADGIVIEIPNESIRDKVSNPECSGAISVEISVKVKSLDYNALDASEAYQVDLAEKAAKAQAKADEKARKIAKDKALRVKKKGEGQ